MKAVKFADGTFLPIFNTERISVNEGELHQYALQSAFVAIGYSGQYKFASPTESFTKTDLAGNVWTFTLESPSSLRITIVNGNTTIYNSALPSNYDTASGWVYYLTLYEESDNDVTVGFARRRPSAMRSFDLVNSRADGSYIDGVFGNNNFTDDLENILNDPRRVYISMRNNLTTGGSFVSTIGVIKRNSTQTVIDYDYYVAPYNAGQGTSVYAVLPKTTIIDELPPPVPEDTDPYGQLDGESDLTGDTVAIPGDPGLSVTSTGIVGLFSPTSQQMQDLADFMWTDFGGTGTTVEDILSEIVQALKRSISNPLDYVIGLNIIPSQGLSKGASKVIRFGFMSSGVAMPELNSQFFTVDCGTLSFDYLCGNTFLDYAPYSKFSIYLPYIGVKEVDANDFVGHTIGVKYKGDVVTGGLTAFITKDGSVMYQYSGSCALNIPLTADNWGSTISAAINVATAIVGAASMPGAGLAASAAKVGKAAVGATVSNVAANPSLLSPQVSRSGAISGGAGAIGVQRPYVIREAVRFHSTAKFNTLTGYPSYYFRSLADVTGYTVVYDCHLENIPATDGEIREIEQLLAGGVIL